MWVSSESKSMSIFEFSFFYSIFFHLGFKNVLSQVACQTVQMIQLQKKSSHLFKFVKASEDEVFLG